jgi:hypothetical protein
MCLPATGIIFTDGEFWENQRRFSLRYMRDFGFGRRFNELENVEKDEIQDVLDLLHGRREDKVRMITITSSMGHRPLEKKFPALEPEGPLPCSQQPATGPSPESLQSTLHFNLKMEASETSVS